MNTKTDPRVRFASLREDQQKLIAQVETHKKDIEILLEQLKALNILLAEAANEIEVNDYRDTVHQERVQREDVIDSLENVMQDTRQTLQTARPSTDQVQYMNLNAQQLSLASSQRSISRLYELAESSNTWNEDQAKEFFAIQDAVLATRNYDLSSGIQQAVDETYQAIQTIKNSRGEDIKINYKPQEKLKLEDTTIFSNQAQPNYQSNTRNLEDTL